MNETINILQENFSVLPQEVREVIIDPATRERIMNGCQKYALSSEQTSAIQDEVFFVLFGIELFNSFRANIVEKARVSYDQALKISSEMNFQVFKPVIEILKEMGDELNMDNSEESASDFSSIPQISKEGRPQNEPETHPDHIIVDHEEMLKKEGPHLHSQTIMPAPAITGAISSATTSPSYRKPEPPPQTARPFKSIVDQKLAGIVRSSSEPARPASPPSDSQNPPPQNPTGAPSGVSSSDNGYKGNDPYREPIE